MKINKVFLFLCFTAAFWTGCDKEKDLTPQKTETSGMPVGISFKMDIPATLRSTGTEPASQVRILAFKKNGNDYNYIQDVTPSGLCYDSLQNHFTGYTLLPAGEYKFVSAYGLPTVSDENIELSPCGKLDDVLTATHLTKGILPVVFLGNNKDLPIYHLDPDSGESQTVKSVLTRAVARVDVLFVRVDTTNGTYQEKAGDNIFGPAGLNTLDMAFSGVNACVNLTDGSTALPSTLLNTVFHPELKTALKIGTAVATTIGNPDPDGSPFDYDAIEPEHIIQGAAHVYGANLFPHADATTLSQVQLKLTSNPVNGQVFQQTINIPDIPIVRNKVTLIKIYVTGDNIFKTTVHFEVTVDDAWDNITELPDEII